jgi:hypothetical protein
MPAGERDRHFRERFDEIDANHRRQARTRRAVWQEKQREYYQQQATQARREPCPSAPHAAAS